MDNIEEIDDVALLLKDWMKLPELKVKGELEEVPKNFMTDYENTKNT